ncbi:unnamed protein product [Closterium sp. Yama58-4]|nr:unnamed protein product [Closterium sp. Yama58-4]
MRHRIPCCHCQRGIEKSTNGLATTVFPLAENDLVETQASQTNAAPAGTPAPAATTTTFHIDLTDDPEWWGNNLPSPTAPYTAAEVARSRDDPGEAELPEIDEETNPPTATTEAATASTSRRRSDARSYARWTREEEYNLAVARQDLDAQIRAQAGQQGRNWYATLYEELRERHATWRHDAAAIRAKLNRMKDSWRRWRDTIVNRSGAGRPRGLPSWYPIFDDVFGSRPAAAPLVLAGNAPVPNAPIGNVAAPTPGTALTAAPIPGTPLTTAPTPGTALTAVPTPGMALTAAPIPGTSRPPAPTPDPSPATAPTPGASRTAAPTPGASRTAAPTPGASRTAAPTPGAARTAAPTPGAARTAAPTPGASPTDAQSNAAAGNSPVSSTAMHAAPGRPVSR